ncbi:hypothetical protein [Nocardia sp. CA-135398]|uniref:hypothetical protein n=1 Tax=Nocardia sp. CA-135398 TaxID=3239977 RepID=UPI003D98A8B8
MGSYELPKPMRWVPTAVVIDTNLWGRGTLDITRLRDLARRLAKLRVKVWIPTQVVMEWARHAVDDIELIIPSWTSLRRAGLVDDRLPLSQDISVMLNQLLEAVNAVDNVTVLPMNGAAAVAGIRDQILRTGAGTVRQGVRTGAADSSWVRDALIAANNEPSRIVFLTKNSKDVYGTMQRLGISTEDIYVRPEHRLLDSIAAVANASEQMTAIVAHHLLELRHREVNKGLRVVTDAWLKVDDISVDYESFGGGGGEGLDAIDVRILPEPLLVGMTKLKVVSGGAVDATIEFEAILFGDLDLSRREIGDDGTVRSWQGTNENAVIKVPLVAEVSDGNVNGVTAAGEARAEAEPRWFNTPAIALAWLTDSLSSLAGVGVDLEAENLTDGFMLTGVGGRTVSCDLAYYSDDEWTLSFSGESIRAAMVCRGDRNTPRMRQSASGRMVKLRRNFEVRGEAADGHTTSPFPILAAVWDYLVDGMAHRRDVAAVCG